MNTIYYLRWRRHRYEWLDDNKAYLHDVIEIVTASPKFSGFFTWIWHGRPLRGNETPFCFPGQP